MLEASREAFGLQIYAILFQPVQVEGLEFGYQVVTVMQRPNGTLLVRAEQPPMGRGDRGEQMLLLVRWAGRPTIAERWSGTAVQRGPRWSR